MGVRGDHGSGLRENGAAQLEWCRAGGLDEFYRRFYVGVLHTRGYRNYVINYAHGHLVGV